MDETSRSDLVRRNEQVKAVSSLMGNAGLALVAAALGRWFLESLDAFVIFWLLAGAGLIWTGVTALAMLEAEN
jgi:sterol desaturase/sphingolipid hydroxylase (fatty acid hydroxylase superfamily)